jgi:hypothetical protein
LENAAKRMVPAGCGLVFTGVPSDTARMFNKFTILLTAGVLLITTSAINQSAPPANSGIGPEYTSDGQLKRPDGYREWVYLSTGFDMSYTPGAAADHHMFDNVFANPEAYKKFVETGTWPDKTMLVLEVRGAVGKGSINQRGNYQDTDLMGMEVHVKDEARFPGKWAFFGFDGDKTAKMVPTDAACYTCHAAHAAVDTTFVQFYPTLLPIAKSKGTLGAGYLKDNAAPAQKK